MIPNFGSIYFDYNPAIITNTFTSTFVQTLQNDVFEKEHISVYPNPAETILKIVNNNNLMTLESIEVFDMMGKNIFSKTADLETIDVSKLASGLYFLKINSNNAQQTVRFLKK